MKTRHYLGKIPGILLLLVFVISLSTCKKSKNETVIPSVTTNTPASITGTSATAGGYVSSDGGSAVTERGVCYSRHENPAVSDSAVISGGGTGSFECAITGLDGFTRYYVRAYARNSAGTGYGNQVGFTTTGVPAVTTTAISNTTQTTAMSGGNVTSQGSSPVTARGICWSSSPSPVISDEHTTDGAGTGNFTSIMTGLSPNTPYYVRAYATNASGTGYGNQVSFTIVMVIKPPTVTTSPVGNITETSATCGGNVTVQGSSPVTVRGVCWNTTGNPTLTDCLNKTQDGSGTGAFTSNITGLTVGTVYYATAYATNESGTAYGAEVKHFITQIDCDPSITINHVAGNVAPVTKTVTYGIVSVPGEPLKCWITSNLGASRQATAKNDHTEASAGWWWQFNRKQGYKHDGTTRTPNTAWITQIDENSDWQAANDPCALELGDGWHIPTSTEWTNVDEGGNWTNSNGPWNSDLKLHAAGYLYYSNGSLDGRGSYGVYWSNTQSDAYFGWSLIFHSDDSHMVNYEKVFGFSARCLRD
jgi:hypothetical protein